MMSAPAVRNASWMPRIGLGLRQDEQIVVALEIGGMIGEARAAKGGLVQAQALHHRAHGPVEYDDALSERRFEPAAHLGTCGPGVRHGAPGGHDGADGAAILAQETAEANESVQGGGPDG